MIWKGKIRGHIAQGHVEFWLDLLQSRFSSDTPPNKKWLEKFACPAMQSVKDGLKILHSNRRRSLAYVRQMALPFSFCVQFRRCLLPKRKSRLRSVSTKFGHTRLSFHKSSSKHAQFHYFRLSNPHWAMGLSGDLRVN